MTIKSEFLMVFLRVEKNENEGPPASDAALRERRHFRSCETRLIQTDPSPLPDLMIEIVEN